MYGGLLDPKRFFNFAQTVQFSCEKNVPYLGLSNITSISGKIILSLSITSIWKPIIFSSGLTNLQRIFLQNVGVRSRLKR